MTSRHERITVTSRECPREPDSLPGDLPQRRGALLAIVLVLLVVISLLTAALVHGAVLGLRRLKLAERVAQSDALLQAGHDRAVALWRSGEPATAFPEGKAVWEIPATELSGGALIELQLAALAEGESPRVDVKVTYPREGLTPVRREERFPLPARTRAQPSPPVEPAAGDSESP
jgi:hypothetical protein